MNTILVLVCYMYLPSGHEQCDIMEVDYTAEVYCERVHELARNWFDDIETTKCEEITEEKT